MTAEALIDNDRKLVLPEELLERLHLEPNTRVTVESEGSYILIQTRAPGLYMERGTLVYDHGRPLPPDHVNWLDQAREERENQLLGR